GGIAGEVAVDMDWIDAETLEDGDTASLETLDGILVPGGFGARGTVGKTVAIRYARENDIPFFGICFGMQLAVIETARNLANLEGAGSTEFGPNAHPVIGLMTEWLREGEVERRETTGDLGGTMRLGAYPCMLEDGSRVGAIYGKKEISERHRHRYEVNTGYLDRLAIAGMICSGKSPCGTLPEIVERTDHPWFVGVQFHPELKSKPFAPHPLFAAFIAAAKAHHSKETES
ncbi:MAG: CTP synthetase, partial [Pseudomonadota bacterium]|nr:CTP synthetase [Pseudomonadota bacterium]